MELTFSHTMTSTRKHYLNVYTDMIYYLRRAKICDLQRKIPWWTNIIKKYIKEQIKIFPYMRNRKTFLETSQSLIIRKITRLFQWEEYQLPDIAFPNFTKENLCIQTKFFYSPSSQNKSWNIQWVFTDWKKMSCPFQIWSNTSTLQKHFVRRVTNEDTVPQFHTLCLVGSHQLARNVHLQPHHLSLRQSHLSK